MAKRKYRRRRYKKKSLKQIIKDTVEGQAEKHIFDTSLALSVNTSATITNLTPIAQGDLVSQRAGSKVSLEGFLFNYNLKSADQYNLLRVIIFQWNDDNASCAPALSDILQNTGSIQEVMVSPYLRKSGTTKYRVLLDKIHALNTDYSGDITVTKPSKNYIRKGFRKSLVYNGSATTGTNQIYSLVISDSSAVNHPYIYFAARALFTDI